MRAAAFFDLDKTVIAKASMLAFGRTLYREGLISRSIVVRALYGQLVYMHLGASDEKLARMRDSVLALAKGWEKDRLSAIVAETLESVIEPIIYAEALALLRSHRKAGHEVWIVSASPEEIVGPLGTWLGVDGVIATRAAIDDAGRYTGGVDFYAYGRYKAEAMCALAEERGLDLAGSWAYSDSATDIPMLEAVGHPVVVNPDRELARAARVRDWEIRRFERPVRLRSRLPVPPPGTAAAATGALGAGLVAGAVWWWVRYSTRSLRAVATPTPTTTASSRSFLMGPRYREVALEDLVPAWRRPTAPSGRRPGTSSRTASARPSRRTSPTARSRGPQPR